MSPATALTYPVNFSPPVTDSVLLSNPLAFHEKQCIDPQETTKISIELTLDDVLNQIEDEKKRAFSKINLACKMGREFAKEARSSPLTLILKICCVIFPIVALHPLVLGAIACFNTYRLEDSNNLYSSDLSTANTASQLFSNIGHGPGYLIEGLELMALSVCFIFRGSYTKTCCLMIESIYNEHIRMRKCPKESNFLYDLRQNELAYYGQFIASRVKSDLASEQNIAKK